MKWKKKMPGPIPLLTEVLQEWDIDLMRPKDDPDDWVRNAFLRLQSLYWIGFVPKELWATLRVDQMTKAICSKLDLHLNIEVFKKKFSEEEFDFWPRGFSLPGEYQQLCAYWKQFLDAGELHPFILKPPNAARGEKIRMSIKPEDIDLESDFIVKEIPLAQEYVMDPLLLDGHKSSLRIYVAVSGMDPLTTYIYPEGLVRICSEPYTLDLESFGEAAGFVHLTNVDLNKHNPRLAEFRLSTIKHDGLRCDFSTYFEYWAARGLDMSKVWAQIEDAVVKSLLAAERPLTTAVCSWVKSRTNAFELFGYDFLLDSKFKPHLLEINHSPSLSKGTELENKVKKGVLRDLLTLVDLKKEYWLPFQETYQQYRNNLVRIQRQLGIEPLQKYVERMDAIMPDDGSFHPYQMTVLDLRTLMHNADEETRCQRWKLLFPTAACEPYLKYLSRKDRNRLHIEWRRRGYTFDQWFGAEPHVPDTAEA